MDNQAEALAGLGQAIPFGVMANAVSVEALQTQLDQIQAEAQEILEAADAEGREPTEDELATVEAHGVKAKSLRRQIDVRSSLNASTTGPGRRTTEPGTQPAPLRASIPAQPKRPMDPKGGFQSFGEFAINVKNGCLPNATPDPRLVVLNATSTFGAEGVGADGGFAVPPEWRKEIWQKVLNEDSLASRCDQLVTGASSMTIPKDETTPWQTSGGVQVYWEGEGGAITPSKPALQLDTIRLVKMTCLVPVSEELLEDAPGIESFIRSKAPAKMQAKLNTAIVRGSGAGQPKGILNADSLITISKETGQPAATIYKANIDKMWARLYAPSRRNAVWLINQDIEPQLEAMEFAPGAMVPVPAYMPPGGAADTPYGRLKGRPVIPVSPCSTLGVKGDIILVDLNQYMLLTRGQQIKTDVSMHFYFDQALMAFRFIFRVNGQPWWGSSITPENGSNTLSWATTLEARA